MSSVAERLTARVRSGDELEPDDSQDPRQISQRDSGHEPTLDPAHLGG